MAMQTKKNKKRLSSVEEYLGVFLQFLLYSTKWVMVLYRVSQL